jgi:hypothetical protein
VPGKPAHVAIRDKALRARRFDETRLRIFLQRAKLFLETVMRRCAIDGENDERCFRTLQQSTARYGFVVRVSGEDEGSAKFLHIEVHVKGKKHFWAASARPVFVSCAPATLTRALGGS